MDLLKTDKPDWKDQQALKETMEDVKAQLSDFEDLAEQLESLNRSGEKHNLFSEDLMAKFKDLQKSFLYASVSDAECPTDYAIYSVLYKTAAQEGIRYAINGHTFRSEGTVPKSWSYFDGRYINSVHKKYGSKEIKSFPVMRMHEFIYYTLVKRIKDVRILEYLDYNKKKVSKLLEKELDWVDYGGHHHENAFTHFVQGYYLPTKFGIDKRKTEYSALVRSAQMKREDAINEINNFDYNSEKYEITESLIEYCKSKLELSDDEFQKIMSAPHKTYLDFDTYYDIIKFLKLPMKIASQLGLIPLILHEKYAKI